ncbi:MAG: low temperature requirement protein A [Gammaproteobacteria bacterium]|nr:low temperature requirement protein A [Gammaproteobacteria bacterium]
MSSFIRPTSLRLPDNVHERHATWLEIFFDLIFAVITIQLSEKLLHDLTFQGVFQCAALFIPVMWMWVSYTVFAARFDNGDALHWVMTFVIMFAGVIMAIQIPAALDKGAIGFSIGFLIGQIALLLLYTRTLYDPFTPKNMIMLYLIGFSLGGICWIMSLFFDAPIKFILWSVGIFIYVITPWIGRNRILTKAPLDTVYIPERFGAFTIIILGQIIASVVFGLAPTNWHFSSLLTSIMAFILAILIWSQYYRFTQKADYKCTLGSGQPYIYTHVPLIISLIIIGACAEEFIRNPLIVQDNLNNIFCFAIILYLTSFYLLQRITMRKFKIRGLSYVTGITATLFLFLLHHFSSVITLLGIILIFAILFGIQFWVGHQTKHGYSKT